MSTSPLDTASAIITRQFDLADGSHVDVFIWQPECSSDDYPTCSYLIRGLGDDRVRKSQSIDGMDAVMSAMKLIGTTLYSSQQYKNGDLTWLGARDLGLPLFGSGSPPQNEYEKADILAWGSWCSVLLLAGNKFPYVAWPGDRLQQVILRLQRVAEAAHQIPHLKEEFDALMKDFTVYQEYYERVCETKGFDISYIKEDRDAPERRTI